MSKGMRAVWVCDYSDCGHEWLVNGYVPEKCAKCRRRGWNKDGEQRPAPSKRIARKPELTRSEPDQQPSAPGKPSAVSAGQQRNAGRKGYDHNHYLSLKPSDQLRYLREHGR